MSIHVHGPHTAKYTAVFTTSSLPCTDGMAVFTARTRPSNGRVRVVYNGRLWVVYTYIRSVHIAVYTAVHTVVYTVVYTDRVHVRVQDRVHGHGQAVYACTRLCT